MVTILGRLLGLMRKLVSKPDTLKHSEDSIIMSQVEIDPKDITTDVIRMNQGYLQLGVVSLRVRKQMS